MIRKFTKAEILFLLFLSGLSTSLVVMAGSKYGLGVSTDGLHYLSSADNLAKGFGLMDYKGAPLDSWAPLLPALMAGLHFLTGVNLLTSAAIINIASVILSVWLLALMIKDMALISNIWFYVAPSSFTIFSSSIALAANVATEPVFALVVLYFLHRGRRYFKERTHRNLIYFALVASLAPVIRWVGVSLAFVGVIFLFQIHWKDFWAWIRRSLIFGLIASAPFVAWVWGRNYRLVGNFVGPRQMQYDYIEPWGNLELFYARISQWFIPNAISKRIDVWLIALGLVLILVLVSKRKGLRLWWQDLVSTPNLILLVYSSFYIAFMVFAVATREHTETYDDRYLLPMYLPFLLLLFHSLDKNLVMGLHKKIRWGNALMISVLSLWLAFQGLQTARLINTSMNDGVPYYNHFNTSAYNDSGFLQKLEQIEMAPDITLYSNDAAAVYFFTGMTVRNSPSDSQAYIAEDENVWLDASDWPREDQVYLIWLLPNWKKHYFSPEQLGHVVELDILLDDADGQLYLVHPRK